MSLSPWNWNSIILQHNGRGGGGGGESDGVEVLMRRTDQFNQALSHHLSLSLSPPNCKIVFRAQTNGRDMALKRYDNQLGSKKKTDNVCSGLRIHVCVCVNHGASSTLFPRFFYFSLVHCHHHELRHHGHYCLPPSANCSPCARRKCEMQEKRGLSTDCTTTRQS